MKLLVIFKLQKPKSSNAIQAALNAVKQMETGQKPAKYRQIANDNLCSAKGNAIRVILLGLALYSSVVPAQARSADYGASVTETPQRISDIVCYQGGQKIIEESNLHNLMFGNNMIYSDRSDGKRITILGVQGDTSTVCKLVEQIKTNRP